MGAKAVQTNCGVAQHEVSDTEESEEGIHIGMGRGRGGSMVTTRVWIQEENIQIIIESRFLTVGEGSCSYSKGKKLE